MYVIDFARKVATAPLRPYPHLSKRSDCIVLPTGILHFRTALHCPASSRIPWGARQKKARSVTGACTPWRQVRTNSGLRLQVKRWQERLTCRGSQPVPVWGVFLWGFAHRPEREQKHATDWYSAFPALVKARNETEPK